MNDDQLSRELARRANAAEVPDLLPAVRAAIDTRPAPVRSSRLAPLAGVAGIAAALVLLAIAIPRLVPGPVSSNQPVSSGVPSVHPTAAGPATPDVASLPPAARLVCDPGAPDWVSGPPVFTVEDASGLVTSCEAGIGIPDVVRDSWPFDVSVTERPGAIAGLNVVWQAAPCERHALLHVSGRSDELTIGIDVPAAATTCPGSSAHWVIVYLREPVSPEFVAASVRSVAPQATHLPSHEVGPAWWELAVHERPTAESTSLDVVVYERACASGQSPEGRIVGPEIEYGVGVVSITFHVQQLSGAGDCQMAPGVPTTVQLSEPLGDRRINDGGFNSADVVIEASEELLAISSSRVDELAYERFEAMVGGQTCTSTVIYDRYVPTQEELEAAADELEGEEGFIEYGGYVAQDWLSAARAFGAIEAYGGRPKPWYIVTPGDGSPVLAPLDPFPISGGRTIWFAGFYHAWIVNRGCEPSAPSPDPSATLRTIECSGAPAAPESGAVWIEDQTGLVRACEVARAQPPDEAELASTADPPTLSMTWQIPCASDIDLTQLEFWHRPPRGDRSDPSRFQPPYLLVAHRMKPSGRIPGCVDMVNGRHLTLLLEQPIDSRDVEVFFTEDGRGVDRAERANAAYQYELTVEADKGEYAASELIYDARHATCPAHGRNRHRDRLRGGCSCPRTRGDRP
jgi:hypothetical protein